MPDRAFLRWQELQQDLREAEQRLVLASSPASSEYAGGSIEELRAAVAKLRTAADEALRACLTEASRTRRVSHSVGLDSSLGSRKPED